MGSFRAAARRDSSVLGRLVAALGVVVCVLHAAGPATLVLAGPEWYRGRVVCVFDSSAPDGAPADASPRPVGSEWEVTGPTVLMFRKDG